MFAVDTLIYMKGRCVNEMVEIVNADSERINCWLRVNRMKLNVDKTKGTVMGNKRCDCRLMNVTIDGERIELVDSFKYLVVYIDNKFSFVHTASPRKKTPKLEFDQYFDNLLFNI
jgi:hypothetical protein